jgi:hypothetical protein
MFNKPGHCMNREALIDSLIRLRDEGWIEFARFDCLDSRISLTNDDISDALIERGPAFNPKCIYYGLTGLGGAAWESFARPDWGQFVRETCDTDAKNCVITCLDENRLRQHIEDMNAVTYVLSDEPLNVEPICEWQATYWRFLPSGYRAKVDWSAPRRAGPQNRCEWLAFVGYCSRQRGWYRWG